MKYRFIHFILHVAQTKEELNSVDESLEQYDMKETKAESENTRKIHVCKIYGIFFRYEDMFVSIIYNHRIIFHIQFNDI